MIPWLLRFIADFAKQRARSAIEPRDTGVAYYTTVADLYCTDAMLNTKNVLATTAAELKRPAEGEVARLSCIVRTTEMDKQNLEQEVQDLARTVDCLRHTAVYCVDEPTPGDDFANKLKLEIEQHV